MPPDILLRWRPSVFGGNRRTGSIAPGFEADVVAIDGDPTVDIRTLGQVRLTIKRGRILYDADAGDAR